MMTTSKMRLIPILPSLAAVLILAACATQVPLDVQRTPAMDTAGVRRIAVMPFTASSSSYQNLARHATSVATTRIQGTNHFTLVNAQEIQNLRQRGESIEGHVDALFQGEITHVAVNTTSQQHQRTNRETGVTTYYTVYTRTVEVNFNYYFTRARDGSIIGPINRSGRRSVSSEDPGALTSADQLAMQIVDAQLGGLHRDVAPYTARINRRMESEPNRDLRPLMNAARDQVRSGSYRAALETYLAIYREHGNIAAAINAAIMYEALGETQTAANFMQGVLNETGNPRAREVLAQLNRELQEMGGVAEHLTAQSLNERTVNHAIREIQRVLPANARVWIHNNEQTTHQGMVNDVVDNIVSAFIRDRITVVDRANIDLIVREQNLHLTGSVSDNDFVSIGNLAGADTIVIVNVTGTGDLRRLQVRVLDIARGVPILQSDTGENWRI